MSMLSAAQPGLAVRANLRVRLELAYRCNLRCRMCDFSLPDGPGKTARAGGLVTDLTAELLDRICTQVLGHARECVVGLRAEPMMCSGFLDKLSRIAATGVPIMKIHTNGTLMDERASRRICDLGVHTVIISVDGASRATFEDIRQGARFDAVLKNQARLVQQRGKADLPRIQWNAVMMRRNLRELPALVDLATDSGVQFLRVFHMVAHQDLNIADESCALCPEETNEVVALARERARIRGLDVELPPHFPVNGGRPTAPAALHARTATIPPACSGPVCGLPWEEVTIDHLGRVFPCVFWYKDPPLGNLADTDFDEIWNGPPYRALRAAPVDRIENFSCNHCPVAAAALGGSPTVVVLP